MNKVFVIFSLLIAATLAGTRNAYVCEVVLPNFDDSIALPMITLSGSQYDLTEHFNAISFDGFYSPISDIEGRLAVRNNLNLSPDGFSIGYELRTGGTSAVDAHLPYALVVGGNAVWKSGSLHPAGDNIPYQGLQENAYVGGTSTGVTAIPRSRISGSGNKNAEFDNAQAYYTALSAAFAAQPVNARVSILYGTATITCPSAANASWYINMTGAAVTSVNTWTIVTCNPDSQIVINIIGNDNVKFSGNNVYHRQERVLYNVVGSGRTVTVITEVRGSILAPNNIYNQPGQGVLKGLLIAGNVARSHQINRLTCQRPPAVPTSNMFCPSFETDCAGLTQTIGGRSVNFKDFNAISFKDFNAASGDVEGRLAARNNVNLGTYSVGFALSTFNNIPDNSASYAFIAGGNATWTSGSLSPDGTGYPHGGAAEGAFVGGVFTAPDYLVASQTGSCGSTQGCLEANFDSVKSCYAGYQSTAAAKSDNVDEVISESRLALTCRDNTATEYVVSIDAAQFALFTYTTVANCNFQAGWIINVPAGTSDVVLTGDSFPAIPGATIYNIAGERNIVVTDTAVAGHVLAPSATLQQTGGVIQGKVVVGDVAASLQINKMNTCPDIRTVRIPIVAAVAAQQGSYTVTVADSSTFRVNDQTTLGVIRRIDGNVITFVNPLSSPVSAGAKIGYATIDSRSGRGAVANPDDSSASAVGVAAVALIAAALLI